MDIYLEDTETSSRIREIKFLLQGDDGFGQLEHLGLVLDSSNEKSGRLVAISHTT